MSKFEDIKDLAYRANMRLPELDLVVFTFGNASVADQKQGVFAIKPSGVKYESPSHHETRALRKRLLNGILGA